MPRHLDPAVAKANMIKKGVWPISDWPKGANQWLCVCMTCGDLVKPRYRNVMRPGRGGCDTCAKLASGAARRISDAVAVETMRRAGVEPLDKYPGYDFPWRSRCLSALCPGLWMGDPADISPTLSGVRDPRRASASACKYCARVAIRPEHARQQMIQRGVMPLDDYTDAWWRWRSMCLRCEREVWPSYANVVLNNQGGCEHCGGRKRVPDEQAATEMMAVGAEPLVPYPGVNARWKSKCQAPECPGPDDRVIYPRLGWIRRGSQACKWCAGVIIDPDTARDIMINRAGLTPEVPYPGVREPWKCYCPRHEGFVYPTLGSVNSRGTGCVECGEFGFKKEKPAQVYLITLPRLNIAKVGICNVDSGRLQKHARKGWVLHNQRLFAEGRHAAQVEREVIAEWRAQGWGPVRDGEAKYDGWTETVQLTSDITVVSLWSDVIGFHALVDGE